MSEKWLRLRLGLIDRSGGCVDNDRDCAVSYFINDVIELNGPALAAFFGPDGIDQHEWHWRPPKRASFNAQTQKRSFSTHLRPKHILGHWWRSRLGLLTRDQTVCDFDDAAPFAWRERAESVIKLIRDGDADARLLFLGDMNSTRVPDQEHVNIPHAERWWWVARSIDGARFVIVDLDAHTAKAADNLDARMRVLLSPGMPKPHIIVTSRRGGRHLWYLVEDPVDAPDTGSLTRPDFFSRFIAQALARHGIPVAKGSIEVFPVGRSQNIPAIPFGDRSFLCDEHGAPTELTGVDAVVAWYKSPARRRSRYSSDDLKRADPSRADAADLNVVRSYRSVRCAEDDDTGSSDTGSREQTVHGSQTRRHGDRRPQYTLAAAKAIYEAGAHEDCDDDLKVVTRYIKHHLRGSAARLSPDTPDHSDEAAFTKWASDHPLFHQKRSNMLSRFRGLFRNAWPLAGVVPVPTLTIGDLNYICKKMALRFPQQKDPRSQAGLLSVYAFCLGCARASHLDARGHVVVPILSTALKAWRDKYPSYLKVIGRFPKLLRIEEEATSVRTRNGYQPEMAATYRVRLPKPKGEARRIESPPALAAFMADVLTPEEIRAAIPHPSVYRAGDDGWRRLFSTSRSRP